MDYTQKPNPDLPNQKSLSKTDIVALTQPTVLPMSQLAIAAFIFGVLQLLITTIIIIIAFKMRELTEIIVDSNPYKYSSDIDSLISMLSINLVGILGTLIGFCAVVVTSRKKDRKDGQGLAAFGTIFSVSCVAITLIPAWIRFMS